MTCAISYSLRQQLASPGFDRIYIKRFRFAAVGLLNTNSYVLAKLIVLLKKT